MDPKRKKKLKECAARRAELRRRHEVRRLDSREDLKIQREVDYIVARAGEREGRIVAIGSLVLFSTPSGDAWILDPDDGLAACLARDGDRQPVRIVETESNFAIEWQATYTIDAETFTIVERDTGRIRTIIGYPTREILAAGDKGK